MKKNNSQHFKRQFLLLFRIILKIKSSHTGNMRRRIITLQTQAFVDANTGMIVTCCMETTIVGVSVRFQSRPGERFYPSSPDELLDLWTCTAALETHNCPSRSQTMRCKRFETLIHDCLKKKKNDRRLNIQPQTEVLGRLANFTFPSPPSPPLLQCCISFSINCPLNIQH